MLKTARKDRVVACLIQGRLDNAPKFQGNCTASAAKLWKAFQRPVEFGAECSPALPARSSSWLGLAGTLPLARGHGRPRWPGNTSEQSLASSGKTSHRTQRPHLANGGKAAFLLHQYFISFKYCDNWSALVVTIQAQEPGLGSIMNTVCLPHLFPARLNYHPSSKNKNNLMKIGKWALDTKLFFSDWSSFHCSVNSLDLGLKSSPARLAQLFPLLAGFGTHHASLPVLVI